MNLRSFTIVTHQYTGWLTQKQEPRFLETCTQNLEELLMHHKAAINPLFSEHVKCGVSRESFHIKVLSV